MNILNNIKQICYDKDLSPDDLLSYVCIDENRIKLLENNETEFYASEIALIAKALKVDIDTLFNYIDNIKNGIEKKEDCEEECFVLQRNYRSREPIKRVILEYRPDKLENYEVNSNLPLKTFNSKKYKELQSMLPEEVTLVLELENTEITEDEFEVAKYWLKYFNVHFKIFGLSMEPIISRPRCSKTLELNFEFYNLHIRDRFNVRYKTPYHIYLTRLINK